jgi:hypothetical protein
MDKSIKVYFFCSLTIHFFVQSKEYQNANKYF